MAYRYGNRSQHHLLPSSIEEYVSSDAPVRAYDVFVDALDFGELGIDLDSGKDWQVSERPALRSSLARLFIIISKLIANTTFTSI